MMRLAVFVALAGAGVVSAFALGAGAPSTVVACATVSLPAQTLAVNTVPVATLPSRRASRCVTDTVPTVTETSSLPGETVTVTAPAVTGTTSTTVTTTPAPTAGAVYISPSGNDTGPCSQAAPCATFDRGFHAAVDGGQVVVGAGQYGYTSPSAGDTQITPDASKLAGVTFICAGGDVTFAAPNFDFTPGTANVTVRGSCFRFHVAQFGWGGYTARTHDIVLDGVHTDSFQCAGCSNVTIRNSEVGPFVGCYRPGRTGTGNNGGPVTAAMWCDPADPVQGYYATLPAGTENLQGEPYIHNGAAGVALNFTLENTRIHGIQTKDSFNIHTGGLLIWNTQGLVVRGCTFDSDAVYDIEDNAGSNTVDATIVDTTFGFPVIPVDQAGGGQETGLAWREVTLGSDQLSNVLIQANRFSHGLLILTPNSATGVRVVGNDLGRNTVITPASAATLEGNT